MRNAGFSLVETTLAIGIVSVMMLGIIALVPLSLDTVRDAGRRSAESLILASVRARCATALPAGELYFDSNGAPLRIDGDDTTYIVTVRNGGGLALPGETEPALRSAFIEMRNPARTWTRVQTLVLPP